MSDPHFACRDLHDSGLVPQALVGYHTPDDLSPDECFCSEIYRHPEGYCYDRTTVYRAGWMIELCCRCGDSLAGAGIDDDRLATVGRELLARLERAEARERAAREPLRFERRDPKVASRMAECREEGMSEAAAALTVSLEMILRRAG
jgi:hypothetical protein